MVINQSNLDALFQSFSTLFTQAYMGTPAPLVEKVGAKIPSNTRDQRYPFMQTISGAFRQWTGPRQVNNVAINGFVVTNIKWEDTLSIERTDLEDDQYGIYSSMLIPNLARNAAVLPDQQVAGIFNSNPTCFDGRTLFASNHYQDPQAQTGSQSNSLGTKPLNATNLAIAQATMMTWKGPDGIPLGSYGDTILVPPSLAYVAATLANAAYFPESKNGVSGTFGAQSNVFQGAYKVVVSEYLTDSGDPTTAVWYLCDTRSASMRAVLWQEREAPQLVSLVDPASPTVFFEDRYYMGGRARGAAAAGLWFKAIKVSGA
jgi:phage major head subunit gpT-like protein